MILKPTLGTTSTSSNTTSTSNGATIYTSYITEENDNQIDSDDSPTQATDPLLPPTRTPPPQPQPQQQQQQQQQQQPITRTDTTTGTGRSISNIRHRPQHQSQLSNDDPSTLAVSLFTSSSSVDDRPLLQWQWQLPTDTINTNTTSSSNNSNIDTATGSGSDTTDHNYDDDRDGWYRSLQQRLFPRRTRRRHSSRQQQPQPQPPSNGVVSIWVQEQYHIIQSYGISDWIAGSMVGIMIVPQSMSYAKLAGLSVEFGLYSSFIPLYTYALYGILPSLQSNNNSSNNVFSILSIGPVALISLMLSSGLSNIMEVRGISPPSSSSSTTTTTTAELYTQMYEQLAIQCSFLVGIICLLFGICRYRSYNVGTIISHCLSHTVISGFTSGAATIIALSQCKYMLGYTHVPSADTVPSIIFTLWLSRKQLNVPTLSMGCLSLFTLLLARHLSHHPIVKKTVLYQKLIVLAPLLVTVTAVVGTISLHLQRQYDISIVGNIPRGFPHTTIQSLLVSSSSSTMSIWYDMIQLFPVALSITIIGFMETIAIAKQLASKQQQQQQQQQRDVYTADNTVSQPIAAVQQQRHYAVDTSQEFIALGVSNVMGSIFHSYPVAGSFSRSAINYSSGAQTRYSGFITACIVGLALLVFTPFFEQLPYNTLAAIVISGVIGLFDYNEAVFLWNVDTVDFIVWCMSCGCTMFFGCEYGLVLAITSSLLAVLYTMTYLPITVLGHVPGTNQYRNVQMFPEAVPIDGIVMIRFCGPICFANIPHVERTIQTLIYNATFGGEHLEHDAVHNDAIDPTSCAHTAPMTPTATTLASLYVTIDMSCVAYVDGASLRRLKQVIATTSTTRLSMSRNSRNDNNSTVSTPTVHFFFAEVSKPILQQLEMAGLLLASSVESDCISTVSTTVGRAYHNNVYPSLHDAVQHCLTEQQW